MTIKRIMICLDGSKPSLRALAAGITMAKQTGATIVGVHSDTTHGLFTAVHTPIIKEEKWTREMKGIIDIAQEKSVKDGTKFEGLVIAGSSAGIDLTTFANNPKNKIDHIVVGTRGLGFPREIFLGSTSNFILHKAKAPVTIVK